MTKSGRRPYAARTVGDLAGKLLNPIIEQRAGMTLDILAQWSEIVGAGLMTCSRPERLEWANKARHSSSTEPATLVVACEGGRALFLQHESDSIIRRANAYFGYRAITRLRIVQKPVEQSAANHRETSVTRTADIDHLLDGIDNDDLRAALQRLGDGVFSRSSAKRV